MQGLGGHFFCQHCMELLAEAGHISTSEPEYTNHSAKQFIYFGFAKSLSLSAQQRLKINNFKNVSRLATVGKIAFFSFELIADKKKRSQEVHDIHTFIHPLTCMDATICFFLHNDEMILSFVGYKIYCIFSDWYSVDDDDGTLARKLDIGNMNVTSHREYFLDFIYSMARNYYIYPTSSSFAIYKLLPIDFFSSDSSGFVSKEEIKEIIEAELSTVRELYGDDYVEYNENETRLSNDIETKNDIELLLLDLENDEEAVPEEYLEDSDLELETNQGFDEYELSNLDSELFEDPVLMVKWLQKTEY